jgi:Lon protease-like protein
MDQSTVTDEALADATMLWQNTIEALAIEFQDVHGVELRLCVGSSVIGGRGGSVKQLPPPPEATTTTTTTTTDGSDTLPTLNARDYECMVCHELLVDPVVLSCGHSFCRACVLSLTKSTCAHKCPVCRRSVFLATLVPAFDFARLLGVIFPDETKARRREMEETAATIVPAATTTLPLFLLEPLLPGQVMHLHVFEPRYRALIQQNLESGGRFGMGIGPRSEQSAFSVTQVSIVEHSLLADGRFNVTIRGHALFRVSATEFSPEGFLVGSGALVDLAADDAAALEGADRDGLLAQSHALSTKIDAWLALVRDGGYEASPTNMVRVLEALGSFPTHTQLSGRALYVGALINPLPGE